jgi:hypothetical protein
MYFNVISIVYPGQKSNPVPIGFSDDLSPMWKMKLKFLPEN